MKKLTGRDMIDFFKLPQSMSEMEKYIFLVSRYHQIPLKTLEDMHMPQIRALQAELETYMNSMEPMNETIPLDPTDFQHDPEDKKGRPVGSRFSIMDIRKDVRVKKKRSR